MQYSNISDSDFYSVFNKRFYCLFRASNYLRTFFHLFWVILIIGLTSCKKLVEISEPRSTITTTQVFSTDAQAEQAMSGLYYFMVNSSTANLLTGGMTIYSGLSSDELILYNQSNATAFQFNQNNITSTNSNLYTLLWKPPFTSLYATNAVIEGLNHSTSLSDSVKKELLAESYFVRAFINFYLVNLYGDIPYLNNTNWRENGSLNRSPVSMIYQYILNDLQKAMNDLPSDYRVGKDQRIIPNKWAAKALLARVYLYLGDWTNGETLSTQIINSSIFGLEPVLNDVFKPNNQEAIWQLQQDNSGFTLNATAEGRILLPSSANTAGPFAYVSNPLLNAFELNDNRKTSWTKSKVISTKTYYYPYKYKIGSSQAVANGPYTEYYMVLRLAEQYLIRGEARAKLDKLIEAIADINVIRQRAGLSPLPNSLAQQQVLDAVEQERRVELFAEWGHRWLDLKRWGRADAVLNLIKGANWQTSDQLYPIPQSELLVDPNLIQNPGY